MFRRGAGRLLALFLIALAAEQVTRGLPRPVWFASVFALVFIVDNLKRFSGGSDRPLFLEDIVLGLALYTGLGYLSFHLDVMLSSYTQRHASPAFPAVVLAILDKSWPSETYSTKRM